MSEILDLISVTWEFFKFFYSATSSASEAFLNKSLKTESTEWATLLTDIIAVSAALGALALPLSLSVIEATRSRYKSPTLLSIYTDISKTNPQTINRLLFSTLTFTLFLKLALLSNAISFVYIIPLIFALTVFFSSTISELYRHLSFTYKLMSDVNSVKNDLLNRLEKSIPNISETTKTGAAEKTKKTINLKKYNSQIVKALVELETYDICSNPNKRDIDERLKKILYKQSSNLSEARSEEFMHDILGALPRMMAEIETSRELDIYQSVSGLYLYLLAKAVIASSNFSHHLDEAVRISRFREQSLPPYGQFCRNGRIFMNCILKKPSQDTYAILFGHFKKLLWNALHTNPENIPEILSNADSLLFGSGYDEDPSYTLHYSVEGLWDYKENRDIVRTIKSCQDKKITIAELEKKLLNDKKPAIIEFLKQRNPSVNNELLEKNITDAIEEVITSIASSEISAAIEIETLQTLGMLLETRPDLIIKCREIKNPAGANAFNIGRPIVPSSINACINALVYEKNFIQNFSIDDVLEFKIVDAIGVLIIYEIWKDFIFNTPTITIDEYTQSLSVPSCTIRELKSAHNRIEVLEKSFKKILSNKIIIEKLSLLEAHTEALLVLADKLSMTLREKISEATRTKIKKDPLDSEALDRFRSELVDDLSESQALLLLKQVRLTTCKHFTFTMERPRESFLADTGTHYAFNGIGSNLLNRYAGSLAYKLLQKKGLVTSVTYPSPFGVMILLTHKALFELKDSGYSYSNNCLSWPGQIYQMPFYVINAEGNLYYQIYKGQRIFDVDYSNNTNGYPITIEHKDNNEDEIETSIRFNFSLSKSIIN